MVICDKFNYCHKGLDTVEKVMTITGYKSYELNIRTSQDIRVDIIKYALKQSITAFVENGGEWILTSGQIGVEIWACQVVQELSKDYPIKYAIIPPFENQQDRWSESDQQDYQQIIEQADFYDVIYKGKYKGAYQYTAKDHWLLNKSDCCLILTDEQYPGSVHYFLNKAKEQVVEQNFSIYYITPFDLEEIVRQWQEINPEQ